MAIGNYAKEFSTVEELDKFLKGAVSSGPLRAGGQYTVTQCGTRRKITRRTGIEFDVYYVIGWESA